MSLTLNIRGCSSWRLCIFPPNSKALGPNLPSLSFVRRHLFISPSFQGRARRGPRQASSGSPTRGEQGCTRSLQCGCRACPKPPRETCGDPWSPWDTSWSRHLSHVHGSESFQKAEERCTAEAQTQGPERRGPYLRPGLQAGKVSGPVQLAGAAGGPGRPESPGPAAGVDPGPRAAASLLQVEAGADCSPLAASACLERWTHPTVSGDTKPQTTALTTPNEESARLLLFVF